MASVKFNSASKEYALFKDYYSLCQKLWNAENEEKYWEEAAEEVRLFEERYTECPEPIREFVKGLNLALIYKLECEFKLIAKEPICALEEHYGKENNVCTF